MKITLQSGENKITTTCTGVSQHIHNRAVVHGLSKIGKEWIKLLDSDHAPIQVITRHTKERLDYLSADPLP